MPRIDEVVLVDYLRTPMSRSRPRRPEGDVFHEYRADELLAQVIRAVVDRAAFDPADIDDLITGCAFPIRENWLYGGRNPVFLAGLPATVPAMAIDRQCASSMSCVHAGVMEIMTGNAEIVLACGMEHMTRVPMQITGNECISLPGQLTADPAYAGYELETGFSMIQTAQKLWEENHETISREAMDQFSLDSHAKAVAARDAGFFDGEILPVEGAGPDGTPKTIRYDQAIREGSTLEKMKQLPVVSRGITREPQVTPGNASPLNAGAGCCVLMAEATANELGATPLARFKAISWAAVNPSVMGKGPVPASHKALDRAGMQPGDVDYWEINEAFAIVPLYAIQELGLDPARVNVMGGAIALGHALGLTGLRLVGTLARILHEKHVDVGLATPCVGGGQGTATVLERV